MNKNKPTGIPQRAMDHMEIMEEFARVTSDHCKWMEDRIKTIEAQLVVIKRRLGV